MKTTRRGLFGAVAAFFAGMASIARMAEATQYKGLTGRELRFFDGLYINTMADNALKWAAEFRKIAMKLGYSDMDEGWLIAWFANAIECSHDLRMGRLREQMQNILDIQCSDGNWNYDPYMHGMANGLILADSLIGGKEPEYLNALRYFLNRKYNIEEVSADGEMVWPAKINTL